MRCHCILKNSGVLYDTLGKNKFLNFVEVFAFSLYCDSKILSLYAGLFFGILVRL